VNWKDELAESRAYLLETLPAWVRGHRMAKLGKGPESPNFDPDADPDDYDAEPELVDTLEDAEVITSWTGRTEDPPVVGPNDWSALAHQPETFHRPILDLDFDAHLFPSSSADHHHLYLDKVLKWSDYVKLLDVLAEVGIIEPGYRDASIAREFTAVRLPWVSK
jgi:hypothetical protein